MLKVLVITGPTATGKTKLGVTFARLFNGEVVSADSMQLYKNMVIGTAAPSKEEMMGIPHHLIGTVSPFETYSAARYVKEASACIEDIAARNKLPIIVGGTGLYIDSLISGRSFMAGDEKLRERLSLEYDSLGGEEMLRQLGLVDRVSAEKLHFNDKKRIVRALEVYYATGKTISKHNEETKQAAQKYQSIKIALNYTDRNRLYTKINLRVDSMMTAGLVNEVEGLLASGLTREHTAMQAIGYKEIAAALQGECAIEEAVEMVKLQSRRYAKRQLSWLNGKPEVNWIMWDNEPDYYKASLISTKLLGLVGIM